MNWLVVEGVSDADRQADGEQELSGEEPRGGRDARLDVDNLLRQDWNADTEPHDGRPHVVRRPHRRGGHQRRSVV